MEDYFLTFDFNTGLSDFMINEIKSRPRAHLNTPVNTAITLTGLWDKGVSSLSHRPLLPQAIGPTGQGKS